MQYAAGSGSVTATWGRGVAPPRLASLPFTVKKSKIVLLLFLPMVAQHDPQRFILAQDEFSLSP